MQGTRVREYAEKRVDEGGILHKGGVIVDESGFIVRVAYTLQPSPMILDFSDV